MLNAMGGPAASLKGGIVYAFSVSDGSSIAGRQSGGVRGRVHDAGPGPASDFSWSLVHVGRFDIERRAGRSAQPADASHRIPFEGQSLESFHRRLVLFGSGSWTRRPHYLRNRATEIRNYSGATLSSGHITEGVKRVLTTYALFIARKSD
jgi:hypothetical protein